MTSPTSARGWRILVDGPGADARAVRAAVAALGRLRWRKSGDARRRNRGAAAALAVLVARAWHAGRLVVHVLAAPIGRRRLRAGAARPPRFLLPHLASAPGGGPAGLIDETRPATCSGPIFRFELRDQARQPLLLGDGRAVRAARLRRHRDRRRRHRRRHRQPAPQRARRDRSACSARSARWPPSASSRSSRRRRCATSSAAPPISSLEAGAPGDAAARALRRIDGGHGRRVHGREPRAPHRQPDAVARFRSRRAVRCPPPPVGLSVRCGPASSSSARPRSRWPRACATSPRSTPGSSACSSPTSSPACSSC